MRDFRSASSQEKREREKKKTPCHKSKAAPCSTVMDDRGASDAKKAPKGFFSLSLSFPSSVSRRNLRPFVSSPSSRWLRIGSVTQERRRRWEGYDDEGPSRETAAAKKMFEMISLKFLHLVLPKRQTSFALPPFSLFSTQRRNQSQLEYQQPIVFPPSQPTIINYRTRYQIADTRR